MDAIETISTGRVLEVRVTGKLTKEAYHEFVPAVDAQIKQHGKLRILFVMRDFHGWTAGAMWEDLKFDLKHWKDIERLAVVGDKKWEKGIAAFCKPFTKAKIRYFDVAQVEEARNWLEAEADA
jgi:SpoIIAA-like